MSGLGCIALLAALALDGEGALRHASRLSALGPHPFGSPRSLLAAEYVASQFRAAGLQEVRLQVVEGRGVRGANVAGVLRAAGTDVVVLAAHHDTIGDSPGAFGSGGGVGVLIEAARALSSLARRNRTIVFVSLDGREPALGDRGSLGARAFVQSLGREAKNVVGVVVVERVGRAQGPLVFETLAYADPLRPGRSVIAPFAIVGAGVTGAHVAGLRPAAGDPSWSWPYQAMVRTFRATGDGDDRPFLEAGIPALRITGRPFLTTDAHDGQTTDTADGLSAEPLSRAGALVLATAEALQSEPRPEGAAHDWFLGWGRLLGRSALLVAGALSLVPGLLRSRAGGLLPRLVHAGLFAPLLYFDVVPALFVLAPINVMAALTRRGRYLWLGFLPGVLVMGLGGLAWSRGLVRGLVPALWEVVVAVLVAALALASGRLRSRSTKARGPREPARRRKWR